MYHFILNPKASSGKGAKAWGKVEAILKKEGIAYEAHMLKSAKETVEFVEKLTTPDENCGGQEAAVSLEQGTLEGEEKVHIVVLGGDGTLNTVLNGIVDFEHTIISCIRTGSGNDFARNVGINKNVEKAITHLLHTPKKMCLDYGIASYETEEKKESRRFIISSGVGYDADICEEVGRSNLKKILNRIGLGKLVYVMIGIKQIFTRVNAGATVYIDEERMEIPNLFFVVGMIHEMEGGGVPFCPKADPTDGLLDVCLVKQMSRFKLLLAVLMVYVKQHYRFRNITAYRCRKLRVKPTEPQWFHMDGETPDKIVGLELESCNGLHFYM